MKPHRQRCIDHHERGFTLLEAVLVIALTGIVAAMVGVFVRQPINAYVDQGRRAELGDSADTALRQAGRELSRSLPNSVRVDPSGRFLEFVPVKASGRYRAAPAADGSGDFLDFDTAGDDTFDVLGPTVGASSGDALVVYNLGLPGADAYAGDTRRPLLAFGSALASIHFSATAGPFPFPSPGNRFQIVGAPVTLACAPAAAGTGSLRRYTGYGIAATQPADAAAAPLAGLGGTDNSVLADKVSACSFAFSAGASARTGLVTMRLTLESGGEQISLLHQAHIDNSP